ncbi:nitrile hydratase subunit beta [Caballeronia sordidicola]|uniref:nitrile hydratase subunit beta n=1 Tax=Caballeronia sordidicola TaxID=196367 RepID=UPI0015C4ED51|nr:nitrile hydratase subunit beta [Caballeronia sordidicola]
MNGIHDIGGRHGLGPVIPEANEPPFHEPWEGRMHGIAVACQVSGINNSPEHRSAVEQLPYTTYLHNSYYENWVCAFEAMLVGKGIVTLAELQQQASERYPVAMQDHPREPTQPSEYASKLKAVLYQGAPQNRPISRRPKFKPGDPVRTLNLNSRGHSRLPGYVRDKTGVIELYHGAHCHAEAQAEGRGEVPEHLYAVRFTAHSLWGPDSETGGLIVYVDLFEDYLQAI